MICLSIETSCDDSSVAIVDNDRRVLSLYTVSQAKEHANYGGVIPELASRRHDENLSICTKKALDEAKILLSDVNLVAVTVKPGLKGPLLVGGSFAKGISFGLSVPVVGVDHIEAHTISSEIENHELSPPYLSLVVSGGHASIIDVPNHCNFSVYAQTRDDAVGEILDKIARFMGIPYPGGAALDEISFKGDPHAFIIPRPKFENFDFSFSGIKTWAFKILKEISEEDKINFVSSLVYGIAGYVSENLICIAKQLNRNKIALGGGVASSKMLRTVLDSKCKKNNLKIFYPSRKYCSDNAAMIGLSGIYNFQNDRILNIDDF